MSCQKPLPTIVLQTIKNISLKLRCIKSVDVCWQKTPGHTRIMPKQTKTSHNNYITGHLTLTCTPFILLLTSNYDTVCA